MYKTQSCVTVGLRAIQPLWSGSGQHEHALVIWNFKEVVVCNRQAVTLNVVLLSSPANCLSQNSVENFNIKSTAHFKTQSMIPSIYFNVVYLSDKACFERASFFKQWSQFHQMHNTHWLILTVNCCHYTFLFGLFLHFGLNKKDAWSPLLPTANASN